MITMTDAVRHTVLGTRIGDLTVVRDGGLLTGLYFPHHWYRPDPATFGPSDDEGFDQVAEQLAEYLGGRADSVRPAARAPGHASSSSASGS